MVSPTLMGSSRLSYSTFKVDLPLSISQIKRNFSLACPTVQPNLDSCPSRTFSQVCLDCVKVTLKANHHAQYQIPSARHRAIQQLQCICPTRPDIVTNRESLCPNFWQDRGSAWLGPDTAFCQQRFSSSHLGVSISPGFAITGFLCIAVWVVGCLSSISHCCNNTPDQKQLKGEGFLLPHGLMTRSSWWGRNGPGVWGGGHIASAARKRRRSEAGALLMASFSHLCSVLVPRARMALPTCRVALPFSVKPFWKQPWHSQRCVPKQLQIYSTW